MTLHRSSLLFRKPVAVGATFALALGGAFASSPAFAEAEAPPALVTQLTDDTGTTTPKADAEPGASEPEPSEPEASADEADGIASPETAPPSEADVQVFEAAGIDLVGVGVNAAGETVVVTTGGDIDSVAGQEAIEEFASSRGDADEVKTIELEGPVEAVAAHDLVGGSGYIAANTVTGAAGYCSLGFAAWSPSRAPAFITAGHCMNGADENIALASIPSEEPAVGGPGTIPSSSLPRIGTFGFAQYGGVGGTVGASEDPSSIDIAVIDVDDSEGWALKPEVTDWTTPGQTPGSLVESTTKVEQVGLPQLGPIARSGRTTGFQEGTVRDRDILDGWIRVSGRWVHGFSSAAVALPGDSGGSVVQGTTAVGLVSGTAPDVWGSPFLWSSLLQESLPATGGYEVALDIAAPEVGANKVAMGDGLAVSVPGNATSLTVAVAGNETTIAPDDGVAIIPTPTTGTYEYTLTASNGMSRSKPVVESVTVAPPAPGITSIKDGDSFTEGATPKSISGTGVEGATVEVTLTTVAIALPLVSSSEASDTPSAPVSRVRPDEIYTATVQNGTWAVDLAPLDAEAGGLRDIELAAMQTANGVSSPSSTLEFTVYGQHQPTPPTVKPTETLAKTGGQDLAPWGLAAGAALLLGGSVLTIAAIRRKARAKR